MSRPKSLNWDQEIHQGLKILAFLDSLSRSRLRVSQFYHISRSRFLNLLRFLGLMYLNKSQKCWDFLTNLTATQQISLCLNNLDKNLDVSKSWLKSLNMKNLDQVKKSSSQQLRKSWQFLKARLDRLRNLNLDLDWSWLSRPPSLVFSPLKLLIKI